MFRLIAAILLLFSVSAPAVAQGELAEEDLRGLLQALAEGGFNETEEAIGALAATGDPRIVPALEALGEGDLYTRDDDGSVVITAKGSGRNYLLYDPLSGDELGEVGRRDVGKIKVNNKLRRVIRAALGGLTLRSPNPEIRLNAAEAIFKSQDAEAIEALDAALEAEEDNRVIAAMQSARAAAVLGSDFEEDAKIEAITVIAQRGNQEAVAMLAPLAAGEASPIQEAAAAAIDQINQSLAAWDMAENVWYGISLGSVLLLAAIGLAITFGVMGVINMAHGEMVMLGAYTTFVVQEVIRTSAPGLFDYSLAIAIPLAFLVAGTVGLCVERGIIRFLYGRPLETLLATWGLSLVLQQAVRTIFGPTNREVGNPDFMSGAFELGQMTITYNRLWIVVFALIVFALLLALMRMTSFGLQMRAVTQNRQMASAMGIRTPWVDAFTFALGSGIAGIAGVALSQIDNVSPNLGQSYIIDSFMVVVFGGVGNLWGTLVGAMTLGVINKFLEPYAGAVLGKVLVLVFIILFIQKRPRGLFALTGRAVET
ncbi:MAG: urea ABC transporter permease subunit UrtB [Pseudomonadota bacterium]